MAQPLKITALTFPLMRMATDSGTPARTIDRGIALS
jgi:hypothetical protein